MTDLDQRIASVLRERAEGETDTHRLLRRSRALGRRRQVRRRTATGTALALVGVLGFGGVAGTDLGGLSGRLPWGAATPAAASAVPPRADGVPGAAQRPDLVGTDPQVLHLGVDTGKARYLHWSSNGSGGELIRLGVGSAQPVLVEVSRSAQPFEYGIDGFPTSAVPARPTFDGEIRQVGGTAGGLVKTWQPARGLYARASTLGGDRRALAKAVDALRWNEARRCAAPLRLTTLPEGATVTGCSVDVAAFPGSLTVQLTVFREPATMWVQLVYGEQISGGRAESNRVVGGRPAFLYPAGTKLELLGIPQAHLTADLGPEWTDGYLKDKPSFTEADLATVLAGAQVAKDLTDPETWK
ncbi:hypothetical protein ACPSM1_16740 [Micromonospora chersina]|uniref:hypothetical protein n=1 Tax=Micromonospora chersina TaxID=47854 RepID=UPI003C91730C